MQRRFSTRDVGLTIRMATALAAVAVVCLAGLALAVAFIVLGVEVGNPRGILVGVLFLVGVPMILYDQLTGSAERVLRALRARPDPAGDRLVPVAAKLAALAQVPAPDVIVAPSRNADALAVPTSVLGHEITHLANHDGRLMVFVAGPPLLCHWFWHNEGVRGKIWVIVLLWPLWLVGLLLMQAMSRNREYTADRGSALLTGEPEQLMSALARIAGAGPRGDLRGGAAVSALSISGRSTGWFADHPPLGKRLARLASFAREMGKPLAV